MCAFGGKADIAIKRNDVRFALKGAYRINATLTRRIEWSLREQPLRRPRDAARTPRTS
jgi:hypothetical protein